MNASALIPATEGNTPSPAAFPTMCARGVVGKLHGSKQRAHLEKEIADLEAAAGALAFRDAESALDAIVQLVRPGDEIVVGTNLDAATCRVLSRLLWRRGVTVWCVDPAELAEAVTVRTSLVYVQTHGGTRAVAVDVATVAAACRASGAVLVVDATSASPAAVRPLTSGADVVVHTNADLLSGSRVEGSVALVASSNPALLATLERERERTASLPADSDVGLVSLGLRTLEGRLRTQQTTARRLVRFLASDPAVARVEYAGLARRGTGRERMLTKAEGIEIVFETLNPLAVRRVAAALRRFRPGLFDGTHSAVSIPATHGGRGFPEIERRVASGPLVIRLTIGLEPSDELLADLADALEASGVADTASTAPI